MSAPAVHKSNQKNPIHQLIETTYKKSFPTDRSYHRLKITKQINNLGKIPVVGTFIGTARIVHSIARIVLSFMAIVNSTILNLIFLDLSQRSLMRTCFFLKNQTFNSLLHILRGSVELVPFIGGLITHKVDEITNVIGARYLYDPCSDY